MSDEQEAQERIRRRRAEQRRKSAPPAKSKGGKSAPSKPSPRTRPAAAPQSPGWKRAAIKAAYRWLWVLGLTVLWVALGYLKVIQRPFYTEGSMLISIVLFLLSLPLGAVLRADDVVVSSELAFPELGLLIILPYILANFVLIGAVRGWLRDRKQQ